MDRQNLHASCASTFMQDGRLLQLHFGQGGPDEGILLPQLLTGAQHLSGIYQYVLQCLSLDASVDLKSLLGLAVQVDILSAEGGIQIITGVVSGVASRGSDSGFTRYDLTIEPPLALMKLRKCSRLYQDQTIREIVNEIVEEHTRANPLFGALCTAQFGLASPTPSLSRSTDRMSHEYA